MNRNPCSAKIIGSYSAFSFSDYLFSGSFAKKKYIHLIFYDYCGVKFFIS
jgi:hypothetical protein